MSKLIDLTGQVFGYLTVIKKVENLTGTSAKWLCRCICGNEKEVFSSNLRKGLTQSCGCYRKEKLAQDKLIDLTNNRYGRLLVIKFHHRDEKTRQYYWECLCDCGSVTVVLGNHLKDGHTQSCGCLTSHGEEKISKLLKEENILFKKQYIILSFWLETGGHPRFDFGILNEEGQLLYLIEYDGWQHKYNYSDSKWDRDNRFEIRQQSDKQKNFLCLENNIKLIRIPHTQYKNLKIEDLKLETSNFIIERNDINETRKNNEES